jgi:hypothetical protein
VKITLANGVVLDPNADGAQTLTNWAKYKKLKVQAFATSLNTYLLVENGQPIFENAYLEDCTVHLDIMALDRDLV